MERIKSILELDEEKISLQIFKEHNQFLQKSNEYLMIANKRLWEYLQEKDGKYQEIVTIYKKTLAKKRAIQQ